MKFSNAIETAYNKYLATKSAHVAANGRTVPLSRGQRAAETRALNQVIDVIQREGISIANTLTDLMAR